MPLLYPSQPISLILQEGLFPSRILTVGDTGFSVFRPLHDGQPLFVHEPIVRITFTSSALWTLNCPVQQVAHMSIDLEFPPPADMVRIQRRQYLRVPIELPIHYQVAANEEWYMGVMLDLSAGGCKLITSNEYSVGTLITIEWEVHGKPVMLPGTIIFVREAPRCMVYRVEFQIGDRLREAIVKQVFAKHRQDLKNKRSL